MKIKYKAKSIALTKNEIFRKTLIEHQIMCMFNKLNFKRYKTAIQTNNMILPWRYDRDLFTTFIILHRQLTNLLTYVKKFDDFGQNSVFTMQPNHQQNLMFTCLCNQINISRLCNFLLSSAWHSQDPFKTWLGGEGVDTSNSTFPNI